MSPAGPASARGPEKWSDMGRAFLSRNSLRSTGTGGEPTSLAATQWTALGSVGGLLQQRLEGWVLERLGGVGVVQHLLERLVHPMRLPDLGVGDIGHRLVEPGRRDLVVRQELLEPGEAHPRLLLLRGVRYACRTPELLLPTGLTDPRPPLVLRGQVLDPVGEVVDADPHNRVLDVGVPIGLEGRKPDQALTAVKDHVPLVAEAGLDVQLYGGVFERVGEPLGGGAQLLLVARLDVPDREQLGDHAVAEPLARLPVELARVFLRLLGLRHSLSVLPSCRLLFSWLFLSLVRSSLVHLLPLCRVSLVPLAYRQGVVRALRGPETERILGTIREYVSFQLPSNSSSETASSAGGAGGDLGAG